MPSIVTWNMQGASHSTENKWNEGARNLLTQLSADWICLQECGAVPTSAQLLTNALSGIPGLELYQWGTTRSHVYIVFMQTDPRGNRCNLAVVSRTQPSAGYVVFPVAGPTWRPAIGVTVGGVAFSLHAISPGGPDVAGLLAAIQAAVGGVSPWVAAGDYNCEPDAVPGGAWNVCSPNVATYSTQHPAARIDYMMVRDDIMPVQGTVQGLIMSDHFPVFFNLG
jgi:cytolethal distending toxin subunit B